jgi:MFS transporter, UMF1 family
MQASPSTANGFPAVRGREIFGWCSFDFANSAFTTIVITVVGLPYFSTVIAAGNPLAPGWWGTALAISQAIVLFSAPWVGAVADARARKKLLLMATAAVCAAATAGLFFVGPGDVWLALSLVLVANVAFATSENLCAAFLPEISTPQNVGRISGYGWAYGYVGGLLSLVMVLFLLRAGQEVRWAFLMTAVFFLAASLPTLLLLRERAVRRPLPAGMTYRRLAWGRLAGLRHELPKHRALMIFFGALTLYVSGLMAVVAFAADFAMVAIGMTQEQVIVLFAVLQLAGIGGAWGFGLMQDRTGPKPPLVLSLILWVMVCVGGALCRNATEFLVVGVMAGIALGSLQSAGRAVVSTLTPPGRAGEFFGYWGFFGKLAGVIGPFVFGWMATGFGYRPAIVLNGAFFLAGLLVLWRVKLPREGK